MLTATIAFYCENYVLMNDYLNGDEAAGEQLRMNLVSSVLLSFPFWGVGKGIGYGVKKLAAQTLTKKAPRIAERLIRIFDDPGDAYRWYNKMKKANFADDLIADMADMLGRDARSKLGDLAVKGMSSELLEKLARNADLLEKFSLSDLLAFQNAASQADDIIRLLSRRGQSFVNLYRAYGDDAVTVALKLGDNALDDLQRYGLEFIGLFRTKGDDFARLYGRYGSEFVEDFLKRGDEALKGGTEGGLKSIRPTGNIGDLPKGKYEVPDINDPRPIERQNQTADLFASKGYITEMLPYKKNGNGYGITDTSNPDFLMEGLVFDCYSPDTSKVRNIRSMINTKTEKQCSNIILNLDDCPIGIDDILHAIEDEPIEKLDILIYVKNGKIYQVLGE